MPLLIAQLPTWKRLASLARLSGLMLGKRIASTSYSMSLPVGWVNWMFYQQSARGAFQPLSTMNIRTWQKMIDLNARAFLLGSQLAAKSMPNGGRIVGISSLGSRFCLRAMAVSVPRKP